MPVTRLPSKISLSILAWVIRRRLGRLQGGLEKAPRRRPAQPALLVHMEIADAFIVAGVEIRSLRNPHLHRRFANGIQNIPAQPRRLDPPLAFRSMMFGIAEKMIVQALEDGKDIVRAPAGQSQLPPLVIVAPLAAHRDHGVDRGGTADHLAPGIFQGTAVQARLRLGLEHPVAARIADGEQIADRNVKPDPIVLPARLEQQHPLGGIGGQTIGQHAAGGACPGDDIVIFTVERLNLVHALETSTGSGRRAPAWRQRRSCLPSALRWRTPPGTAGVHGATLRPASFRTPD